MVIEDPKLDVAQRSWTRWNGLSDRFRMQKFPWRLVASSRSYEEVYMEVIP